MEVERCGEMFGRAYGSTSLPTPSARAAETKRVPTRHCWLATCGEKSLEECCNTTASFVENILTAPKAFRHKDQTQLGILLELNQTEDKKTLNVQHNAEENKTGNFVSFYC